MRKKMVSSLHLDMWDIWADDETFSAMRASYSVGVFVIMGNFAGHTPERFETWKHSSAAVAKGD